MKCDICKEEIEQKEHWDRGHNAYPAVEDGRCCDTCHTYIVVPLRIQIATDKAE